MHLFLWEGLCFSSVFVVVALPGIQIWFLNKILSPFVVVVVQLLSHVRLFVTPWTAACQAFLSFIIYQSLLKFMSTELVMPSSHLILCYPLLLLPSIFSSIRVFSNELALHIRWTKCWSFGFRPSKEYSGLISFRIDWFELSPLSLLCNHVPSTW